MSVAATAIGQRDPDLCDVTGRPDGPRSRPAQQFGQPVAMPMGVARHEHGPELHAPLLIRIGQIVNPSSEVAG